MQALLSQLSEIDEQLLAILNSDPVDSSEMARLLNNRKQCLAEITVLPEKPEQAAWSKAIARTEQLFSLIKVQRDSAAAHASRFKKGRQSVQVYKKFE
ncbi:hypothetical protein [Grimontia marina]|uniref:Flagellar protein FliT n=1 Tax=Grimontia marina TaxID=646534 RepID=A0A128ERE7_9GAMM|nr:hypothetical protein [Grimontia marina]CZF77149.1 hypothetical protein GMA8713_00041 [Grimontia marina]